MNSTVCLLQNDSNASVPVALDKKSNKNKCFRNENKTFNTWIQVLVTAFA